MKKLISILALVLVFAFCAAYAENTATETTTRTINITFNNGVKFGMTQDEVKAAEKTELNVQTFGEKQNPHVTVLAMDSRDASGHDCTIQYLFWDGKMYAVLYTYSDPAYFDTVYSGNESSYGKPFVCSSEGTINWVESVSGNRPDLTGDQYVWSWDNKISLTMARYARGFITVVLDAN